MKLRKKIEPAKSEAAVPPSRKGLLTARRCPALLFSAPRVVPALPLHGLARPLHDRTSGSELLYPALPCPALPGSVLPGRARSGLSGGSVSREPVLEFIDAELADQNPSFASGRNPEVDGQAVVEPQVDILHGAARNEVLPVYPEEPFGIEALGQFIERAGQHVTFPAAYDGAGNTLADAEILYLIDGQRQELVPLARDQKMRLVAAAFLQRADQLRRGFYPNPQNAPCIKWLHALPKVAGYTLVTRFYTSKSASLNALSMNLYTANVTSPFSTCK